MNVQFLDEIGERDQFVNDPVALVARNAPQGPEETDVSTEKAKTVDNPAALVAQDYAGEGVISLDVLTPVSVPVVARMARTFESRTTRDLHIIDAAHELRYWERCAQKARRLEQRYRQSIWQGIEITGAPAPWKTLSMKEHEINKDKLELCSELCNVCRRPYGIGWSICGHVSAG